MYITTLKLKTGHEVKLNVLFTSSESTSDHPRHNGLSVTAYLLEPEALL